MFDFSLEIRPRGKGDHVCVVRYTAQPLVSNTMASKLVQVSMQALLWRKMSDSKRANFHCAILLTRMSIHCTLPKINGIFTDLQQNTNYQNTGNCWLSYMLRKQYVPGRLSCFSAVPRLSKLTDNVTNHLICQYPFAIYLDNQPVKLHRLLAGCKSKIVVQQKICCER